MRDGYHVMALYNHIGEELLLNDISTAHVENQVSRTFDKKKQNVLSQLYVMKSNYEQCKNSFQDNIGKFVFFSLYKDCTKTGKQNQNFVWSQYTRNFTLHKIF